jgi:hypothetical protein
MAILTLVGLFKAKTFAADLPVNVFAVKRPTKLKIAR